MRTVALAFDLLHSDDDIRRQPLIERKNALRARLRAPLIIDAEVVVQRHCGFRRFAGEKMFAAICKLGLEGIVSRRITSAYKSGPSKAWIKVKNPKSPAATRAADGTLRNSGWLCYQ